MPRYKGDAYRWKGVTDCTRKAKMYSQIMFNEAITLDLWLTADEERVYVTERNWIEQPNPPELENGDLYCGEVTRHDVKTGDIELAVLRAIDQRDKPWKYAEWHAFLVDKRRERLIEIPRYRPINDRAWIGASMFLSRWSHTDARIKAHMMLTKALSIFNKSPEKKSMMFEADGITILVRGHGYYGDIPAESKQTGNSQA